jgi:type IV pilus assembly protein PilZ
MRFKDRRRQRLPVVRERRAAPERRSHERVLVNFEVDYQCDDTFLYAYVTDLSAMGIFIRTKDPHAPGTRLNLHFRTPSGVDLDLEAQVMWVNPVRPGATENLNPGMGVQFIELTPAQRDQLLHLVRTFAYLTDEDDEPRGNS